MALTGVSDDALLVLFANGDRGAAAELTRAKCSDCEVHLIEECGHWTQQEKPEELTRILVDWLVRRFGKESE